MLTKVKSFSAPLRVYWHLAPAGSGGLDEARALDTAKELAALRVFFITLRPVGGPRADLPALASALKSGGVHVTVSVCDSSSVPAWELLGDVDSVDLCPEDEASLSLLIDTLAQLPSKKPVSVSIVPRRGGTARMACIISAALAAGIREFHLPNPDVVTDPGGACEYVLRESDRAEFKAALEGLLQPYGSEVKLSVHDLFLHGSLDLPGLGAPVEYAGCQGGVAVGFIDGHGMVYPCASWPVALGDLRDAGFREIWSAPLRASLRDAVALPPEECEGCQQAVSCKGGCRGMAFALTGRHGRDPGCGR